MAVNLFTLDSNVTQSAFTQGSLIGGRLSKEFEFTGAKTVRVMTPLTVPMNDYKREGLNRYGEPVEMQDIMQELTLTQDRSFALTIDKGNNADQGYVKNAGKMLALQLIERAVPEFDRYVFDKLAHGAGTVYGSSETLTSKNICDRISAATAVMDDGEVPSYNRTLFVSAQGYKLLKHSDEFMAVSELGKDALSKGVVGMYDNMSVVKVPATRWVPGVNFLIVHKNSATAPVKLNETKLHRDPPGISGSLLEGREYYDCFVFAPRAVGIYADVDTNIARVCDAPTISENGTVTGGVSGGVTLYTVDGTDPRYSASALQGSPASAPKGCTVKAIVRKDGRFDSAVVERAIV